MMIIVLAVVLLIPKSLSFGLEPNRQEIGAALKASLHALNAGSLSYHCSMIRPGSNVLALSTADTRFQAKMGPVVGEKLMADHDVTLPKEGSIEWNQGEFHS